MGGDMYSGVLASVQEVLRRAGMISKMDSKMGFPGFVVGGDNIGILNMFYVLFYT